MTVIQTTNHGPLILSTTYWGSEYDRNGILHLSLNAGALRLLLPRGHEGLVEEMRTGKEVIVSRGPWPEMGGRDALELLFDDGSDSPYAVHLDARQVDRLPLPEDQGKEWVLTAWTAPRRGKPHLALSRPCWYRVVERVPWLKPREQ